MISGNQSETELVRHTTRKLLEYCVRNDWAGHDPYDALNSRVFRALPFLNAKWIRLVLTQGFKRSPLNLRPLLLVPRTHNPKGLALFLSALVKLSRVGLLDVDQQIRRLIDLLLQSRTTSSSYSCWGYSFDWQTRTKLIPRGSPNIICTAFAANALLDAYENGGDASCYEAAASAAQFILDELYCEENDNAWFTYTQLERTQIHNANLLGAALLCRVASCAGEDRLLAPAMRAAHFSVVRQNKDGSWYYGERDQPSQKWIDNFHTGFNLCALRNIGRFARTDRFEINLDRGLRYYAASFFECNGAPKYFHDRPYPFDIHSAAQAIITLLALRDLNPEHVNLARAVFRWSMEKMWDDRGYFYYQKHRCGTNRIPYLRWGQAWMLLALAPLLEHD